MIAPPSVELRHHAMWMLHFPSNAIVSYSSPHHIQNTQQDGKKAGKNKKTSHKSTVDKPKAKPKPVAKPVAKPKPIAKPIAKSVAKPIAIPVRQSDPITNYFLIKHVHNSAYRRPGL